MQEEAKITSRQDALQTVLRGQLTIYHPPKIMPFCEYRLFQQPQALALVEVRHERRLAGLVLIARLSFPGFEPIDHPEAVAAARKIDPTFMNATQYTLAATLFSLAV